MIRGTTAQLKFNLPYRVDEINWIVIKFWQDGYNGTLERPLPITKRFTAPIAFDELDPKKLIITLSAGETQRFTDKLKVRVQFKAEVNAEAPFTFSCKQQILTVYPMKDGILDETPEWNPADEEGYIILDGKIINE